ncbi:MAG: SurA N-terminal domain-containing protein, partial [Gammaproteobacteria bacterium]|nr:SurA N-terminal domain-containing protein [Gammaproteobacteria bacterium]
MLTAIREKATGWIAWIVVGIITLTFALWGIQSYFEGPSSAEVAVVNGAEIENATYQNALSERRRALVNRFGSSIGSDYFATDAFKQQVLDELIDDILLQSEQVERGYRIGDDQLRNLIRTATEFQGENGFDAERYQALLRGEGYTVALYEAEQRRRLAIQQIQRGFLDTVFVPDSDVDAIAALLEQRRDAEYVVLAPDRFTDEVEISPDQVQQYYDQNPEKYRAPDKMRVEFLQLSVEQIAQRIEPTEAELQAHYNQNEDEFNEPDQRRASHILITLAADASEDAEFAALRRANDIIDQVNSGGDFAELAKTHSEDTGSAANGGDLGFIEPGMMVAAFESAVFAMDLDEIRGPVRTKFGFHIIKLTELTVGAKRSFDSVRDEIIERERRQQAELQFAEHAETFTNLVYEHSDTLEVAAEELGLDVQQSDWFSRDEGEGVATAADFRRAAFSESVRVDQFNSDTVQIDADTVVAMRQLDFKESEIRPFDAVRDSIESVMLAEQAATRAEEAGIEAVAELNSGGDWDALLSELDL